MMHLTEARSTNSTKRAKKLLIKFEDTEDGIYHPHCPHGPTLLFYKEDVDPANGFYACSAYRDKKLCNYHLPVNEIKSKHLLKSFANNTSPTILRENFLHKGMHYCLTCNSPLKDGDLVVHLSHNVQRNLNDEQMKNPTLFLPPINNDKANAQYYFDHKALMFFKKCFKDLKINKVVCIGAPRLHAYLKNCRHSRLSSFLLDINQRFSYFYNTDEFAWYNMCNNYFFDEQEKVNFSNFLKVKRTQRLLFFTDPPFGCRTEPIANTLHHLTKLFSRINCWPYQPVSTFWIFPYYSEHYIYAQMPAMEMCDYKINYTNHISYTDTGNFARQLGSPVRLFTNVPLQLIKLPISEGYKYCRICQRYTASENRHCQLCNKCPSKNGATYRHCTRCGICVKPNYVHCENCRRCAQSEGHNCIQYQKNQRCWICRSLGHIERKCAILQRIPKSRNLNNVITSEGQVIVCYLCSNKGHNESVCPQRHQFIDEFTFLKPDKILAKFFGNKTDFFKVLHYNDNSILVGARDIIYNISLHGLRENSRIEWYSSDADRELCALKGKTESDCHNYIRVFAHLPNGQILVCGTNSYKPRCRHYTTSTFNTPIRSNGVSVGISGGASIPITTFTPAYEIVRDVEAQGLCPYSPMHNSTYSYADGQLYSATVADFSGGDPLIYRENLRTEQYDLKQLNQPDFVGAIERDGYVMFFFREIAMEFMNFGKTVYSRVGRVCKNDRGGPYALSKSWTSFLKARLNCSVPGEFPFYFDEIQAISPIIESGLSSLVYAVFTTSVNAIPGSAVCAFNIDDIMEVFRGPFKWQKDSQSQWLPVPEEHVPEPRPGQCVEDSRTLSSIAVNFVKTHPFMEMSVPPVYGRPLLTKVNLHHRLTAIAVDPQVHALDGDYYDVIYTGTDDGKVTKFFNIPAASKGGTSARFDNLNTVLISEMQVLPNGMPVRELVVSAKTNTLLVVSDGSLITVPLHHCVHIVDCINCLGLQDPNCAWDQQTHECKSLSSSNHKFGTKTFLQSLNTTKKMAKTLCSKFGKGSALNEGIIINLGAITENSLDNLSHEQTPKDEDLTKTVLNTKINTAPGVRLEKTMLVQQISTTDLEIPTAVGGDFLLTNFNDDNKITLHSVDPLDLMHSVNGPLQSSIGGDEQKLQLAGKSFYWGFGALALALVFIIGMVVGLHVSKRNCKPPSLNGNHRNQFNSNPQFGLKHGKDINLLMNPNHYCHTKKPNLDLEKDRSHECKNSSENLEKELPCKTSTLTKVKRTYI